MPAIVPFARPQLNIAGVKVGQPPSAISWTGLALLINWLRGKGSCQVPLCFPERNITSGTTETFRFRTRLRSSAIQRVWIVLLRVDDTATAAVSATIRAPGGSGTALFAWVPATSEAGVPFVYVENLASQSSSEGEINIGITANSGPLFVDGIACYDQDRPLLALDSTDEGADVVTVGAGSPISLLGDYRSLSGIIDGFDGNDMRRVGLLHYSVGDDTQIFSSSSATFTSLFTLPIDVIGPLSDPPDTQTKIGAVRWSVYAAVDAGTAEVKVSSNKSLSSTVTISSATFAWATTQFIRVDCDDMSAADGYQGTIERIQVGLRGAVTGGATLTVKAFSMWHHTQ